MSNRKQIGIVGWKVGDNSFGVTVPYYEYFNFFGDVQILSPNSSVKELDLLVLPGGADVNPLRYKAKPRLYTGAPNPFLEYFDEKVLPKYIAKGTPIFGICRGLQSLNVLFGGTLYQHKQHEYSSEYRGQEVHGVVQHYNPETDVLTPVSGKSKPAFKVNSLHHQCIKDLAEPLVATLTHDKDGTIEAIKHRELPIHAVQYHPEELWDDFSITVISKLLKLEE